MLVLIKLLSFLADEFAVYLVPNIMTVARGEMV